MSSDPNHQYNETYGSLFSLRNRSPVIQGVSISSWKPNDRAPRCGICVKKFGFLRRRHHCRACGDVCCRRCLGYLLVDVPLAGVDISYTCLRCITRHNTTPSIREGMDHLARSIDYQTEACLVRSRRAESSPPAPTTPVPPSPSILSPGPVVDSPLTSTLSPRTLEINYNVVISQYHNHKLSSVCSLLGDYLECKGGAIVLMDGTDAWVLAHKGLRTNAMRSPNFLSLCHHALKSKEPFTASRDRKKVPHDYQEAYLFFGAAPIFHSDKQFTPIGCIVALDTMRRDEVTCRRVKKTLESLARLVTNVLADDENAMQIYESGEFRRFDGAKTSLTGRPTMSTSADASLTSSPLDRAGVESPLTSPMSAAPPQGIIPPLEYHKRSRSCIIGGSASFFERYDTEANVGSMRIKHAKPITDLKHPVVKRAPPPPPPLEHNQTLDHLQAA